MNRFDQAPDQPYAKCENCGIELATQEIMREHFSATMTGGSSHRARITNASRAERIKQELYSLAEDAMNEFVDQALELVDREEVTEAEVTEAVKTVTLDFADEWERRDS